MLLKLYLFSVALMRKIPGVQRFAWFFRKNFHALERRLLVNRPVVDGAPLIEAAILNKTPFAAGKMGATEAAALYAWIKHTPSSYISHKLYVNAGVFPQDLPTYNRFCPVFLDAVKTCNALASWDVAGEAQIFHAYCPQTSLIKLRSLEPYFSQTPWSRALANKKVLVISPFVTSIEKQYARREVVWGTRAILPSFSLLTLRAPLSAGLVKPDSKDWFEALELLKTQMDAVDYDVALIGAGAFSLPLAVYAKEKGKVGLHLGGGLQILFGVAGKRWSENKDFAPFINKEWCAPSAAETPENFRTIEGGCYW